MCIVDVREITNYAPQSISSDSMTAGCREDFWEQLCFSAVSI